MADISLLWLAIDILPVLYVRCGRGFESQDYDIYLPFAYCDVFSLAFRFLYSVAFVFSHSLHGDLTHLGQLLRYTSFKITGYYYKEAKQ